MTTGTIKWLNIKQNFGFIKPDGSTDNLVLHISELEKNEITLIDKTALDGLRVSFDVGVMENNRPAAINVKFITNKANQIKTGYIKWFNINNGYGVIRSRDDGDIFLHISELKKANISAAVKENLVGAFISYELHTDIRNRKSATNICFLGKK